MGLNTIWTTGGPQAADPYFNPWGSGISAALTAVGMHPVEVTTLSATLVPTPWATPISLLGAGGFVAGERCYEVWKLPNNTSNTLQPLYIRIGYGYNLSYGYNYPRLTFQVGSTWTTGGIIGGPGSTMGPSGGKTDGIYPITYNSDPGTLGSWAASDGDGLVLVLHPSLGAGASNNRGVVVIDRLRDPATGNVLLSGGASVGAAVICFIYGNNPTWGTIDWIQGEAVMQAASAPVVTKGALSTTVTNLNAVNQTQIYPWWFHTRNGHGVSKMIATYNRADITAQTVQVVGWLPVTTSRKVKALGQFVPNAAGCDMSASAGGSVAIWWED